MLEHLKLPATALKLVIDTTETPTPKPNNQNILGQTRAQSALAFGVAMKAPGYNIFVMGDPGTGRLSMVNYYLSDYTQQQESPLSYAYVENFENPREPVAIQLPSGEGINFSKDIEKLIDDLLVTFPAAFESPSYQQKKTTIERRFNQRYNTAINLVDAKARDMDVALYRDSESITFLPIRNEKALDEEQFTLLPQAEREVFHQHSEALEDYLAEVLVELPQWRKTLVDELRQLDNETIKQAIEPLFTELNNKYQHIDDVITYLAEIEKNLNNTIADYLMPSRNPDGRDTAAKRQLLSEQYLPNILVDSKHDNGCAPVVYEPHPIYQNLFGRIEYISDQGTLVTNYRRICPGALHRANGGYLIIDADKLITYPFVWEGLKRALKAGRIEIESPYAEQGINTITLKPEVIPLNVKIILIGARDVYYLLEELDSEFKEMFRVLADFDDHIKINPNSISEFIALMNRQARDAGSKPLTTNALRCLIEHSCRLAENQHRLSAHINDCLEIIAEANLLNSNSQQLDQAEIECALAAREARNGRIAEEILEEMLEGIILIDSDGEAIGKLNGLTVLDIGGSSFGAPARITATVYPGSRGIVDIEREVELGQPIHSKGVMILTGYLGHCYAQQFPLAISASIAMEQSYGHIDGDSASLAELCCLISALTRLPIQQGFALTGSINQYGEVQAIGGVNEKIEGFFNLCAARGLTGKQAVIIPTSNKRNLMLKQPVIEAVEQGKFAIYAVSNVNQALSLLMGLEAGEMDETGHYPEGSINFKVVARLKEISDMTADEDKETETG